MRFGAVFIAVCMVVIAASAGATMYLGFGFSGTEAIIVALAVMTVLGLYSTFSARMGVRSVVGGAMARCCGVAGVRSPLSTILSDGRFVELTAELPR